MALAGCASLKDTKIGDFYHNVTARYNGYFNSKEIIRLTEENFKANYKENFNEVLPVFRYPDDKGASAGPQMDEVIKKCSKVIQKHPKSKWVDDCYFLIGKAYFYKNDGFAAIEVFQYVSNTYKNAQTGKLADVWIARSYMQMDNLTDAGALVTRLKTGKKIKDEVVMRELLLTEAAIYVENESWRSAAEALEQAIPLVNNKKERTRLTFIQAQLYERLEEKMLANETYNKVIKMNPSYELSFYSRLYVVRAYEPGSGNSQEIKNTLRKLLRDDKNIQYFDQIYYELAILELKEGNKQEALKNLKTSVAVSQGNTNQQAASFLKIAEIHFNDKNFVPAKNYYDSAAAVITPQYPDYENVVARKKVLDRLIDAYITIQREDSLQRVAAMPKEELEKYINAIIEKQKEEKIKKPDAPDASLPGALALQPPDGQRRDSDFGAGSNWYFYNYGTLAIGANEFVKKWGQRPLQDNWRVLKTAVANNSEAEKNETDLAEERKKANSGIVPNEFADVPPDQQHYYQNLPITPVQRAASDNRLVDAYFSLGTLYFEDLKEYERSVENYETLLRRFPDNTYSLRTYYNLYLVYTELGRVNEADKYKQILFKQYPESEYTMLIKDPDALKKKFDDRNNNPEIDRMYKDAWAAYQRNNCKRVTEARLDAEALLQGAGKLPRFEYLQLLCSGKSLDKEIFRQQLEDFVKKYPNEPVRSHAESLIEYLGGGAEAGPDAEEKKSATPSKYAERNSGRFMYILVYPRNEASAQKMKETFSDYNKKFQSLGQFQINSIVLNDEKQIVMVQDFENAQKAMQYFKDLEKNPAIFKSAGLKTYDHFVISFDNFTLFMRDKNVEEYMEFFKTGFNKK